MNRNRLSPVSVLAALVLALPAIASACYCDRKPFRELAASADTIVIGRVLDQATKTVDLKDRKAWGRRYWVSGIKVSRVLRGKVRVDDVVPVGGSWTSCDTGPEVVRVGKEYAFALVDKQRLDMGYYWLHMCGESAVSIGVGGSRSVTAEQVDQWARLPRK